MKLNKFLAVAVAATVLPLSVASAAEVHEKPEFKGGVNGPGLVNDKAPYAEKGTPEVHEKPEFKLEDLKKSEKPTKPRRVLPKTSAAK